MKLFKKRDDVVEEKKPEKLRYKENRYQDLIKKYEELQSEFNKTHEEKTRLDMITVSEELQSKKPKVKAEKKKEEKKPFSFRKLRFNEKLCHTCNHSINKHHKKGRSTGCRCGCLRTIEEIMNPNDNGKNKIIGKLIE